MTYTRTTLIGCLLLASILQTGFAGAQSDTFSQSELNSEPLVCLDKSELTEHLSPPEIWKSISSCLSSENYSNAIFQYALAGVYGRYDSMRVADETAHQAAKILPIIAWESLKEEKVKLFRERIQETLGKDTIRKSYCDEIIKIGPPSYTPNYMLQHGLGATKPYIEPFDSKTAWPIAVNGYLSCP